MVRSIAMGANTAQPVNMMMDTPSMEKNALNARMTNRAPPATDGIEEENDLLKNTPSEDEDATLDSLQGLVVDTEKVMRD